MEGLSTRKLELLPVNNLQLSPKTPVQHEIKKKKKRGREKCLDLMLHLVTGNRGRVIWKRRDRVDPRKPSRSRDKPTIDISRGARRNAGFRPKYQRAYPIPWPINTSLANNARALSLPSSFSSPRVTKAERNYDRR